MDRRWLLSGLRRTTSPPPLRTEQIRRGCAMGMIDVATVAADAVTTGAGTTLRLPVHCPTPDRVLVAHRAQDVADVLDQVQQATDAGRWAYGYVAYEATAGLDPNLAVPDQSGGGMPLVWFGICDEPIAVPPVCDTDPRRPYAADWHPSWTPAGHADQIDRIRDHIGAGDTFQCNLTVRMNGRVSGDITTFYRDLVLRQRGAHNAYLDLGRHVIASASPELFFQRRGDHIRCCPLAFE